MNGQWSLFEGSQLAKDSMVCETQIRVRKITERESFRLMGVKDEEVKK